MTMDVSTLVSLTAANRFLPLPPSELIFVGDGDFRAIGAEFLRHFIEFGGLRPTDRVLEIGCGVGRMAVPLTQYLDPAHGSYDGVDVVRDGIVWCGRMITPRYANFRFHHHDMRHELYNPGGAKSSTAAQLPFEDASFDFVFLTSVVTHLRTAETLAYIGEINRLLSPGGRCFLSLFLMTGPAREGLRQRPGRLAFDPSAGGPEYVADPAQPTAAVAYDEGFLVDAMTAGGLTPARPFAYGHWATGEGANYQDLCLFTKKADTQS